MTEKGKHESLEEAQEKEQPIKVLTNRIKARLRGKSKIKVLGIRGDTALWEKKQMSAVIAAALKQLCKWLWISRLTQSI